MLPTFQAVDLASFLNLDEPICPRFVTKFYHILEVKRDEEECPYIEFKLGQFTFELNTSQLSRIYQNLKVLETFYTNKWSLTSLDDHPNIRFFGPKNDLVKRNITNHVNECTAYMLYYLTIKRKFNFTSMILYRIEEIKNKSNAPMPYAMLLIRLYKYLLQTNPQSIVPLARFTFHDRVMNPLDISWNPIKEKGKRVAHPSSSSASSSSDENDVPSFLEFYEVLSDNEDLTDAQKEKRGMFICLNRYFNTISMYLKNKRL
ncbi:hypothetical protein Tco_0348581 [Tanacetum coccineum]